MNKCLLLFVFAACMLSNTQSKAMEISAGKLLGTFLIGGAVVGSTEWLSKQQVVQSACNRMNLNANDVKRVINLSSACVATSLFTNKETSESLRDFAWKAPLIGIVYTISNTQIAKNIIRNAPFGLGAYLVCPRPHPEQVPAIKDDLIKEINKNKTMSEEEKSEKINNINAEIMPTCNGGCDECQWTSAVKIVAAWTIAKIGAPVVWQWAKTRLNY